MLKKKGRKRPPGPRRLRAKKKGMTGEATVERGRKRLVDYYTGKVKRREKPGQPFIFEVRALRKRGGNEYPRGVPFPRCSVERKKGRKDLSGGEKGERKTFSEGRKVGEDDAPIVPPEEKRRRKRSGGRWGGSQKPFASSKEKEEGAKAYRSCNRKKEKAS